MTVYQFYGNHLTCKIGTAWATVLTSTDLASDFTTSASGTDFSSEVTEVTFTDAASGIEVLNVFGSQLKGETRPELVRAEFTMILDDMSMFNMFYGATTTVATSWARQTCAEKTGVRSDKAILFIISNGTQKNNILMNYAWFESGGEISLPADGRVMWRGAAVCLIDDLYTEQNY